MKYNCDLQSHVSFESRTTSTLNTIKGGTKQEVYLPKQRQQEGRKESRSIINLTKFLIIDNLL